MESITQKRKLQDSREDNQENKKPHSDSDIDFDDVAAESTHIGDQTTLDNLVKENVDDETIDESLVRTVVDVCAPSSGEYVSLQIMITSLKDSIKNKDKRRRD